MPLLLRFILVLGMVLPVVLLAGDAGAIPVFARKYQTSCTTCHHAAFPQLNAFGVAFRDRGYRIPPDDEVYVKEAPVSMGVEPWRKLFPNAVWPGDMPGLPPLSMIVFSDYTITPHNRNESAQGAFNGLGEVELLSSGNFGESLSFFGALALFERNDMRPSNTFLERWFLIYSPQFFNLGHHVNFQVGRFEPRAAPFRNHVSLLAQTVPDLANTWVVVPASNFTTFFPHQQGIELFGGWNGPGGKGGLRWAAGLVNGEPTHFAVENIEGPSSWPRLGTAIDMDAIAAGIGGGGGIWDGTGDVNNSKDYYARLEYKIGGMGVLGGTSPEASLKMSQNWQDPSLTLGTFVYRGNTGAYKDIRAGMVDPAVYQKNANRFWRFGLEATVNWWNFELGGAATFYRDKVAGGVTAVDGAGNAVIGDDFDTDIYTVKLDYVALPWLVPSFRYESVSPDYDVADWPSISRYTALISALVRANVKVTLAGVFTDGVDTARPPLLDNFYQLGLQFNF
jgi:hypothetical protein